MLAGTALSSPRLPRLRPAIAFRSGEPLRSPIHSYLSLIPLPIPRVSASLVHSARPSSAVRSKRDAEGYLEDRDDGYGSENEEMDREEEELEVEEEAKPSDVANSANKSATSEYEDDLVRVVTSYGSSLENCEAVITTLALPLPWQMKWNPFHNLALSGQIPFMDKLLELGIDIDSVDKDGFTALHKAVIGKKEAVITHLLRKGANPHVRDRDGATPLHYAVQVGAKQTVKLLIKYKVDVNVADDDGWTPLHVAIQSRSRDIAKVLLVNGADKTRKNKDGKTPLDLSLCFGRDFKSYELAKLIKLVPANRDP